MYNIFKPAEAPFISLDGLSFSVNNQQIDTIEAHIQELVPVRKLFRNKKIICWSIGGIKAKNGSYCSLCSDSFKCRRRIRIKMLIDNIDEKPFPALLEVNQNSFQSLQEAVEIIGENDLPNKPVIIKNSINRNGVISLTFIPGI